MLVDVVGVKNKQLRIGLANVDSLSAAGRYAMMHVVLEADCCQEIET